MFPRVSDVGPVETLANPVQRVNKAGMFRGGSIAHSINNGGRLKNDKQETSAVGGIVLYAKQTRR